MDNGQEKKVSYLVLDIPDATAEQVKARLAQGGLRVVNPSSANPVLALGKKMYLGRREDLIGTSIILKKKKSDNSNEITPAENHFQPNPSEYIELIGTTEQVIRCIPKITS